jgi:hypothetical protein
MTLNLTPHEARSAVNARAERLAIKVLLNLESHNNGKLRWSAPTPNGDGTYTPGDWHEVDGTPKLCRVGLHLTERPVAWWKAGGMAYLAEYDGATDGPDPAQDDDPTKFAVQRARLLRPLTCEELESHGIYLTGQHSEITDGRVILGGSAQVESVKDAYVVCMYGSSHIGRLKGSSRVDRMDGSSSVGCMDGSSRVECMDGSSRVDRMDGSSSVGCMSGRSSARASGDAVVIVRFCAPTVILRGRASVLDYRDSKRPVHHVADEGQVLTLADDGSVSQAPEVSPLNEQAAQGAIVTRKCRRRGAYPLASRALGERKVHGVKRWKRTVSTASASRSKAGS